MTVASMIRGAVNMLVPAMVISAGVIVLVPLSPCLIFDVGKFSVVCSQDRYEHLLTDQKLITDRRQLRSCFQLQ